MKPLISKLVIHYISRGPMRNVYITTTELLDIQQNLAPAEVTLYGVLKHSALLSTVPDYYSDENLAKELKTSAGCIRKMRSSLKKKGYAQIIRSKSPTGSPMVRVVVGKDQMILESLGVEFMIGNASAYKKLLNKFPIDNPTLSQEQREEMAQDMNEYYKENSHEFK